MNARNTKESFVLLSGILLDDKILIFMETISYLLPQAMF